jgi:hypothetical protein
MLVTVSVTVTGNVAGEPPALLAMLPVHVPAVGDGDPIETVKETAPPGVDGDVEPTGTIVATVPGALPEPSVHVSEAVNVGCAFACETVSVWDVGVPPITSTTGDDDTVIAPGAGDGELLGDGDGDGDALLL